MAEPRQLLLLAAALALGGCLQVQYTHDHSDEPLPEGIEQQLQVGQATMQDCLQLLGAPTLVYGDEAAGISLAWTWRADSGWSVRLSYSFADFVSVSGSYDSDGAETWGVFLTFDPELRLREVRRTRLSEVAAASIAARARSPAGAGS